MEEVRQNQKCARATSIPSYASLTKVEVETYHLGGGVNYLKGAISEDANIIVMTCFSYACYVILNKIVYALEGAAISLPRTTTNPSHTTLTLYNTIPTENDQFISNYITPLLPEYIVQIVKAIL